MRQAIQNPDKRHETITHRRKIANMFSRIATRYDFFNDLISFGLHRLTRKTFMQLFDPPEGSLLLDICAGTGVLSFMAMRRGCEAVLLDASAAMLQVARQRGLRAPMVVADALAMPFADDAFDGAMIGFGLRSMASMEKLFEEIARVVRPGGRVGCLDFTQPRGAIRPLFRVYLHLIIRSMGRLADPGAYEFLANSVEKVVDAETVAEIMQRAGLREVQITRLALGTIACWTAVA